MKKTDRPLTVSQVCDRYPGARNARRVAPSTVIRWIITGCLARNGTKVKLPATRCGCRWLIDQTDLDEFFAALAGNPPAAAPRTPARREREARAADERMAAAGA